MGEPLCQHCQAKKVNRPRGLCWGCYFRPGVRDHYAHLNNKFTRRGILDRTGRQPLPVPTSTRPGTPERVAVLEERAARGEQLFHPADATLDDYRPPCVVPAVDEESEGED